MGISLVEVLVAMVVLTGGLVSTAHLLAVSTVTHADAAAVTGATLDAQEKLEDLLAAGPALQVSGVDSLNADVADLFDRAASGRTRRWRVDAGPVADTRIVRVLVLGPQPRRYGGRVELVSMVRRR
jgi:hypothetical protein